MTVTTTFTTTMSTITRSLVITSLRQLAGIIIHLADLIENKRALELQLPDSKAENICYTEVADKNEASVLTYESINLSLTSDTGDKQSLSQLENLELTSDRELNRVRCNSLTSDLGDELELDLDPATGLAIVSLEEVADHSTPWDAWTVVYDKVYDLTEYMHKHPGGEEVVMEYVGYDATIAFRGVSHSRAAFRMLDKYCVGILPENQRLNYEPDY